MKIIIAESAFIQLLERKVEFDLLKKYANTIIDDIENAVANGNIISPSKHIYIDPNKDSLTPIKITYIDGFEAIPMTFEVKVVVNQSKSPKSGSMEAGIGHTKKQLGGKTKIYTKISGLMPPVVTMVVGDWFLTARERYEEFAPFFKNALNLTDGNTLMHELQHLIDLTKHRGQEFYNARSLKFKKNQNKYDAKTEYSQYVRLEGEINAHLTELLYDLDKTGYDKSNLRKYVELALVNGDSWISRLTPKQKKSVIGKIVAYWHEEYGDASKQEK